LPQHLPYRDDIFGAAWPLCLRRQAVVRQRNDITLPSQEIRQVPTMRFVAANETAAMHEDHDRTILGVDRLIQVEHLPRMRAIDQIRYPLDTTGVLLGQQGLVERMGGGIVIADLAQARNNVGTHRCGSLLKQTGKPGLSRPPYSASKPPGSL